MSTKQGQEDPTRPVRKATNSTPDDRGKQDGIASSALRPAKSGLLKSLTTRIARSSSSLRPPTDNNSATPMQTTDARGAPSSEPTATERRKSLAPARLLSAMGKSTLTSKSQGNLKGQVTSQPTEPPSGGSSRDRRRAEALQSLGLLPASRRYSAVFPEVFVEPKAEGARDGMSAADVIRQEWMMKIKEEGDEDEETSEETALVGVETATPLKDISPQTPVITTTTTPSRQDNVSPKRQKSRVPTPLVLPKSSSDGGKAKLSSWKFPKSPQSSSTAWDAEVPSLSPVVVAESPTSMTSGERLQSPQTGTTVFFSAPSSPSKPSPGTSPKSSRHATKRSDGSTPSSPRSSASPQSASFQTSSTKATSLTDASAGETASSSPKNRRTGSKDQSTSSNPGSPRIRGSVVSSSSKTSSDKVNEWLSKTPVVSRPTTQPPSPSRLSSGHATPKQSSSRSSGNGLTLNIDSLTLPATMIPLPLSPIEMSPRQVPLPASPVDSLPPLSPSLIPLPTSVQATPSLQPATANIPQKTLSTSSTLESGTTLPSLSLSATSSTSTGPDTPISPLDIVAPDRSLPPSPVISALKLQDAIPQLDTIDMSGSQECDISGPIGAGNVTSQMNVDGTRDASPLPDQDSGRTSERTLEGPVQPNKPSKSIFGRRRNTKDSKEGKEQQSGLTLPLLPRASTSFNNLKKSVVGNFSVGSKSKHAQRTFTDPTRLPSRNMNVVTEDQFGSKKSMPPRVPTPNTRAPLSPTMHSRATIMLEAGAIEDDESRRLSEMAFLL
ncbi:hypothetical protein SCHPADRAFT_901886 [Schizopora paradoxa]|uniref:Uncharacterized protein n=1 Tax=Schizopora paradoxa TaxID=27342 RepID=A0A0H2RVL5_9AGAM|nr:hypothetical protein SCHPADRAFT_901886 [Schizopora paradoxa]